MSTASPSLCVAGNRAPSRSFSGRLRRIDPDVVLVILLPFTILT
jgi:hypothetical protein